MTPHPYVQVQLHQFTNNHGRGRIFRGTGVDPALIFSRLVFALLLRSDVLMLSPAALDGVAGARLGDLGVSFLRW